MIHAFLAALQFLTILPVRTPPGSLATAAVFFPVVGALVGLASAGIYFLLLPVAPRSLLAILIVALWAVWNGGLHEDGLADTADAFGGGQSREDILRILKDSAIGSFGALALIFSALLRWQSLALAAEGQIGRLLVVSQVLPRVGMLWLAYSAGGATKGLGGSLAEALTRRHLWVATAIALAISFAVAGWTAFLFVVVCGAVILPLRWFFRSRIGGITGDCLGAANQLQETGVLLAGACL